LDANVTPPPGDAPPNHAAEVVAVKSWFRENLSSLVFTAVAIALVFIYLDPIDTAKVVLGLGFIIFIHELGHFLAAKWCDVHVRTFSIGFGPAWPFCQFKFGETNYKVGMIPLGGYVAMAGQTDGPESGDGDPDEDPRSFKNKSVGQRMLIISAGVVMNIIFGLACFAAAYMHGVKETPASVGAVESGGAVWRAGIRSDSDIKQVNARVNPVFNDLRSAAMSSQKNEQVVLDVEYRGERTKVDVEPLRDEGSYYPQFGLGSPLKLTLISLKKKGMTPYRHGTPAAALPKDAGFQMGDRVVAMSDPAKYPEVTPLRLDPRDPDRKQLDFNEYHERMVRLADRRAGVPGGPRHADADGRNHRPAEGRAGGEGRRRRPRHQHPAVAR
jgi:regulator of sigma E protease